MALGGLRSKIANASSAVASKAIEQGGVAAGKVKEGALVAAGKAGEARQDIRKSFYNPVMPEEYNSPDFDLPMMLVIADEDKRKGIDVCEGAIGWLSKNSGLEVLHLYYEAVESGGLRFQSVPMCDKAYFRHPLDPKLFVEVSSYMDVMQQEQITELKEIGYKLGAKRCRIEIFESEKASFAEAFQRTDKAKASEAGQSVGSLDTEVSQDVGFSKSTSRRIVFDQTFEGDAEPQVPELKWYKNNSEILSLIKMRCSGEGANRIKEHHVLIHCSATATMSVALASKIEGALPGLGVSSKCKLKSEAKKESERKMSFDLVF